MSEVAPGSVSLEDDTPLAAIPEQPPAAEPPAEPPPPAQNAADPDPDGTIEGSGGVKFVPLGAVVETRGKLKEAKAELETLKTEAADLRQKAQQLDQIRGEWNAAQPLIQQLRNGTYQPAQPPKPAAGPLSDQDAIEYAKDLDLYKADGTPDTARAQRLASRQEALAAKQAQQYIQPLQQQSAQQQSAANFQSVAAWKDKTGAVVDPAILQEIWSKMPPELTAKADVAAVMYRVALGETMLQGKHKTPVTPPPPAQHTESIGGGTPRPELSQMERDFLQSTNMKPKDYEDISARFKPGERNSLE